jgi:hypothetical protein
MPLFLVSISAGILGDAFSKLFDLLWAVIEWIGNLIRNLFQTLIDLILLFFEIIFALIDGLLYFLFKIGVLAVKLFQVIFETLKVLYSLVVGFGKTLASLSYTPTSSSGTGYSEMLGMLFQKASVLQLNVIAYILLFIIWMFTAVSAMKLVSSIRIGGD